jgi:phosphoribosyl-dephospho-CoA transferase
MVRRYFALGLISVLACAGCVTVQMPQYLKDKNPYHQEFYTSYDKALSATTQALEKLGWKITKQANPVVFENDSAAPEVQPRQIILFTNVRQTSMLISSRYTMLNVLVKENNEKVEIEIRYYSVLSFTFKNMESYKNDGLVNKVFDEIAKLLSSASAKP